MLKPLLAAIGALTGFAAQHAALVNGAAATAQTGSVPPHSVTTVRTQPEGQTFLLGDWINRCIIDEQGSQFSLNSFLIGATHQAGVASADLPDYRDMFRHVISTLGSPEYGSLQVSPAHQPHLDPLTLLKRLWPQTKAILLLDLIAVTKKKTHEPDLLETHWPILLSYVAALLFAEVKGVLDPLVGYVLVLESAIIASKYHPDLIEPGQWRLEARGQLAIHRRQP